MVRAVYKADAMLTPSSAL